MSFFVPEKSIVRRIWGSSDTIIFIFAGSAAEFALNKAVDWLYFTGRLPADPIGRLFSTVAYARQIVFSENETALKAIDTISGIHAAVESSRGQKIPDWAYRDVLFMLIHYSIASFELLERKLTSEEKDELFDVFLRIGNRMRLNGLPQTFTEWEVMRQQHLETNLVKGDFTTDLFMQYKKHLGAFRYHILLQGQALIIPPIVKDMLRHKGIVWLPIILPPYKLSKFLRLDWLLKSMVLPKQYFAQIKALENKPAKYLP